MTQAEWLSLIVCGVVALCHLAAIPVWSRLKPSHAAVASFSGGAASAYVFLHLFPEIETKHARIGDNIYALVLVGFVFLFALDTLVATTRAGMNNQTRFRIRLGFTALYNLLLAFTMSEQLPLSPGTAIAYTMALGLHVFMVDLALIESFGPEQQARGRFVLAGAILLGWGLSTLTNAPEVVLDVLTALMAGFIVFTVFGEEVPKERGIRLRWFVIGTGVYFLLDLLAHL